MAPEKRMATVPVLIEPKRLKELRAQATALGYKSVEEALRDGIDAIAFRASCGSLTSLSHVKRTLDTARELVAHKCGIMPQEVYYRSVFPDEFHSPNGEDPVAGQGSFLYQDGINRWVISSVGDHFNYVVPIGLLVTDLKDHIQSLKIVLNGNRLKEYPAAFAASSPTDLCFFPDGPILVDSKVRLEFHYALKILGDEEHRSIQARAYPVVIGFPLGF